MSTLPADIRLQATRELRSLRVHAARTGADLYAMIDVPDDLRASFEAFCKSNPRDSADIRLALDIRDFMLDQLTPHEWAWR